MYDSLFQPPLVIPSLISNSYEIASTNKLDNNILNIAKEVSSNLKAYEYALRQTSKDEVYNQSNPVFNMSDFAKSSSSTKLTNEYLMDQKLRNSGLYSKLKNKTMYSQSEFVTNHSILNSGIL